MDALAPQPERGTVKTFKNILRLLAVIALTPVYLAAGLWMLWDGRRQRRSRNSQAPHR
jgi:hypothetical protein